MSVTVGAFGLTHSDFIASAIPDHFTECALLARKIVQDGNDRGLIREFKNFKRCHVINGMYGQKREGVLAVLASLWCFTCARIAIDGAEQVLGVDCGIGSPNVRSEWVVRSEGGVSSNVGDVGRVSGMIF